MSIWGGHTWKRGMKPHYRLRAALFHGGTFLLFWVERGGHPITAFFTKAGEAIKAAAP